MKIILWIIGMQSSVNINTLKVKLNLSLHFPLWLD